MRSGDIGHFRLRSQPREQCIYTESRMNRRTRPWEVDCRQRECKATKDKCVDKNVWPKGARLLHEEVTQ